MVAVKIVVAYQKKLEIQDVHAAITKQMNQSNCYTILEIK